MYTALLFGAQEFSNAVAENFLASPLQRFQEAMDNDFNTSEAIAMLFELANPLVTARNKKVHGDTIDNQEELIQEWKTMSHMMFR